MRKSKIELAMLASLAIVGALTACSTATPSPTPTPTPASAPATSSAAAPTPTTAATSTAATPTGPAASASPTAPASSTALASSKRTQNALSALKTAESSANGKATELDWDVNRWEVSVLDGKSKRELDVSADGKKVIRRETDVADAEDYKRLQSVRHYMADAIKTATAKVPGDIDEVDLEARKGKVVWELSIEKTGGGSVYVYVDAASGRIAT
jgi:uncharacterized membrane protein YkoI